MTARELYLIGRKQLGEAGIEDPDSEAAALCERFFGLDRQGIALDKGKKVDPQAEAEFFEAIEQRADGRPLQYIIGEWEFMGLPLKVGAGVLIPRDDTCVLVENMAARIKGIIKEEGPKMQMRGLDLCAGTGAVALGLCSLVPRLSVTCVEVDAMAMSYLKTNLKNYPQYNTKALRGDVLLLGTLALLPGEYSFIAANPPYIRAWEIRLLQQEIQWEPRVALDGGSDGLRFYRAIAGFWTKKLAPGGILGVEVGEGQARTVGEMLYDAGLRDIEAYNDIGGTQRAVIGRMPPKLKPEESEGLEAQPELSNRQGR